jgi:ribosomal protein S27E
MPLKKLPPNPLWMAMKCEHCGHEFDTVALKAKQGTPVTCPSCGTTTVTKYSFRDSLRDISGIFRRDPKYVSWPLTISFWVVFGMLLLGLLLGWSLR